MKGSERLLPPLLLLVASSSLLSAVVSRYCPFYSLI
jgi:hypothetical protein